MSSSQIDSVLAQIRTLSAQIRPANVGPAPGSQATQQAAPSGFANLLKQGLDQVNQTQQRADTLMTQFERGTPGVELPQVMLEMQKANVSFRAVTEVRNKMVNAYQEIMNMPI